MVVKKIVFYGDVLQVALTHALTTEQEEIAGVLIGNVKENICHVFSLLVLMRSDKRKDRVELSYEQLAEASQYCERLSRELSFPLRVIGWYHSHPHITVWPSHVDIRTQWSYQQMDQSFVGLIVSVFNTENESSRQRVSFGCFQSLSPTNQVEVPLEVVAGDTRAAASCLHALISVPGALMKEEEIALAAALEATSPQDRGSVIGAGQFACVFANTANRIMGAVSIPLIHKLERTSKYLDHLIANLQS